MKIESKNVDTAPTHRRMGGAFDILAKTLRKIGLISFSNGFSIRNRAGLNVDKTLYLQTGLIDVKSMTEAYYEQPSTSGINGLVIGRTGDGQKRNLHFADISVDYREEIGDSLGYVNGVFRVRSSRNGVDETIRDGLYVFDRGTESSSREGSIEWLVAAGDGGQIRLSYMPERDGNPLSDAIFDLYISKDGFVFYGLPTSAPSARTDGGKTMWNDAGTLKVS